MKPPNALLLPHGERLSYRLLFWILLLSSLFTLMATLFQLYADYSNLLLALEYSMDQVQKTVLPAVTMAVWALDREALESILAGVLTQREILHVEVLDNYNNALIQLGEINKGEQNLLKRNYTITFIDETGGAFEIGQLSVTATLTEIYRQLMDKVFVILISQGIKTFLMSACILILVEWLVIRHLNKLASWASNMELGRLDQPLIIQRKEADQGDVIDRVVTSINTMQHGLVEALAEREQADIKRRESERLVRSIVDNSPSVIYAKDPEGRYTMVNNQFLATFGQDAQQVLGQTDRSLFPQAHADSFRDNDLMVAEQATPVTFDEKITLGDKVKYYMSVKFPIFNETGQLIATGGVSTDITDRRNKEQQIIELNETLEQKVRIRTSELEASLKRLNETQSQLVEQEKMACLGQLTAGLAHEVNTPLGIGVTAVSLILEASEELQGYLKSKTLKRSELDKTITTINEGGYILKFNLQRAADLVQSFKKIAVDQTSEEARLFNVRAYISDILLSLSPLLKYGGLPVKVDLICESDVQLYSYPGDISQLITNLVTNSVQHGFDSMNTHIAAPRITLSITRTNQAQLLVQYRDNGKGLTDEAENRLFEPFYTTARGMGGSGLGMSIVYNLVVQKLQGEIAIDRENQQGFGLTILLPVELDLT